MADESRAEHGGPLSLFVVIDTPEGRVYKYALSMSDEEREQLFKLIDERASACSDSSGVLSAKTTEGDPQAPKDSIRRKFCVEELLKRWEIGRIDTIVPTITGGGRVWFVGTVANRNYVLKEADLARSEREHDVVFGLSGTQVPIALPEAVRPVLLRRQLAD